MTILKWKPIPEEMFAAVMAENRDLAEEIGSNATSTIWRIPVDGEELYLGMACLGSGPGHEHAYAAGVFVVASAEDRARKTAEQN